MVQFEGGGHAFFPEKFLYENRNSSSVRVFSEDGVEESLPLFNPFS
jgi:hypothetical protein